jgi:hypothetical protein
MDTPLLDAAFRLVSHSLTVQEGRLSALATEEARLAELHRQFPDAEPGASRTPTGVPGTWKSWPSEWRTWRAVRGTTTRVRR